MSARAVSSWDKSVTKRSFPRVTPLGSERALGRLGFAERELDGGTAAPAVRAADKVARA